MKLNGSPRATQLEFGDLLKKSFTAQLKKNKNKKQKNAHAQESYIDLGQNILTAP